MGVNAYYRSSNSIERALSNLNYSPFIIDGRMCSSIEGFYQGVKRAGEEMQNHIFLLFGMDAKNRSKKTEYVYFNGEKYRAGSKEHHELIFRAQVCKYTQHSSSREALLSTGNSLITHHTGGRNSALYPAKIYTGHLMQIRTLIQKGEL